MTIIFKEFSPATSAHYQLLLEADPAKELVDGYLKRSLCIELTSASELVGIVILLPTRPETIEIVNLAVKESFQGQGFGQRLLEYALEIARQRAFKTVEIGTGSTSFGQLYLYQKCGFRMTGIDQDFFTRHYSEKIIENKLQLKDMVRLSQDLF